jgi:hypothetical protein
MYQLEKEHTENESRAFSKSWSSYDFKAAAQVSSSTFKDVTVVIVIPSVSGLSASTGGVPDAKKGLETNAQQRSKQKKGCNGKTRNEKQWM